MSTFAEHNYLYRRPELYDELATDPSKAREVTRIVAAYGFSAASRILDLGCGTGQDLGQLDHFPRRVGVDLQEGMIAHGRLVRPALDLRVGDLRSIRLRERFDVITCLGNSYAYLHADADQRAAWGTFTAHGRPGATLLIIQTLLDPIPPTGTRRGHASASVLEADTSWEIDWDSDRRLSTMRRTWHLDEPQVDTIERRVTTPDELAALAIEHGWTVRDMAAPAGYFVAALSLRGRPAPDEDIS